MEVDWTLVIGITSYIEHFSSLSFEYLIWLLWLKSLQTFEQLLKGYFTISIHVDRVK